MKSPVIKVNSEEVEEEVILILEAVYVSFYNLINVQIYTCLSFSIQEFSLPEPMN
jgi:hypothetical protein